MTNLFARRNAILAVSLILLFVFLCFSEAKTIDAMRSALVANAGWNELGNGSASGAGISNTSGDSTRPVIKSGSGGNVYVTWVDDIAGNQEIYVRRWNGSAWMEMGAGSASGGGISNNIGISESPAMAIGSDGLPIIAWRDDSSGNNEIYLRRWNGSAWVEMGVGSASGGGVTNNIGSSQSPSLAVGPDNIPVLVWRDETSGDPEIYASRWNGSAWVEMGAGSASGGGISQTVGGSFAPSLAIGPDNAPVVAWRDDSNGNPEIYVRRWNGTTWAEMGSNSASGGGISNNQDGSFGAALAIGSNGHPIVAWQNAINGTRQTYIRRWSGSSWVEMGNNSASGSGISNTNARSYVPTLATSANGTIVVAWPNDIGANREIYARYWNGSGWDEVGTGAASGTGISNTAGESDAASVAIGSDGMPIIAWADLVGNREIYVRKYSALLTSHRSFAPAIFFVPPETRPPCFNGPNESEPNNNQGQANGPLCKNGTYQGLPNDRLDFFVLDTQQNGNIRIKVDNHRGTGVQINLYYQTASGNPVAFDSEQANGLLVEYPQAQVGRYFIVVYTENPKPNESTPYTMQITFP